MFSDHNVIKLEINNKKLKYPNIWNALLNNPQVKEEIIREIKKYFLTH